MADGSLPRYCCYNSYSNSEPISSPNYFTQKNDITNNLEPQKPVIYSSKT